MKELEYKIEIKEHTLIDSNYNTTIQTQRDSLIKELHGNVNEKKKKKKKKKKKRCPNNESSKMDRRGRKADKVLL